MQVLLKFSWLVVSSLASQGPVAPVAFTPGMPAVVLLDDAAFISRYAEKRPLDRCVLEQDLGRILAKSPRIVAVDFDLSPLVRMSAAERQCQESLDALLDREASRLLVLVPFPAPTQDMYRAKHDWMLARCQAGLRFADGTIEQSMGLVTEQVIAEDPSARARFADQLHSGPSNHVCESLVPSGSAAAPNPWLIPRAERPVAKGHEAPINFPEVIRSLAVMPLDSVEFDRIATLAGSAVVFGGSWGEDDTFLTAIGRLPGAVLHGLRLVNLANPVHTLPPILGFLFDISIALCFAWVVHFFWGSYVTARRIDLALAADRRASGLSTFVMLLFVAVYATLVLLFFLAAEYLYAERKVLIAPLLIAVGILVDGFVTGPVEQMEKLLEPHGGHAHGHEPAQPATLASVPDGGAVAHLLAMLKWTPGLLAVVWGLYWLEWLDLRRLAGDGLMVAEVLLALLLGRYLVRRGLEFQRDRAGSPRPHGSAEAISRGAGSEGLVPPSAAIGRPVRTVALGLAYGRTFVFWIVLLVAAWYLFKH